jgi:hypothetical protein
VLLIGIALTLTSAFQSTGRFQVRD